MNTLKSKKKSVFNVDLPVDRSLRPKTHLPASSLPGPHLFLTRLPRVDLDQGFKSTPSVHPLTHPSSSKLVFTPISPSMAPQPLLSTPSPNPLPLRAKRAGARGASLVEYVILLVLILVLAYEAFKGLGSTIRSESHDSADSFG